MLDTARARETRPHLASRATPVSIQPQDKLAKTAPLENSKAQLGNHHATVTARLEMEGAQESHLKHLAPRARPEGIPSRDNLAKTAGQESTQPPQEPRNQTIAFRVRLENGLLMLSAVARV